MFHVNIRTLDGSVLSFDTEKSVREFMSNIMAQPWQEIISNKGRAFVKTDNISYVDFVEYDEDKF